MAQCFITTYRNHYRWYHNVKRTLPCKPVTVFPIPAEEFWIEQETEEELDPATVDEMIHEAYKKLMVSTYQRHYCTDWTSSVSSENQLMKYCRDLYEQQTKPKIAPPLPDTRKKFGYIRPTRNYTPMTNYQGSIGKTGYNILKGEDKRKMKSSKRGRVTCGCKV